MNPRRVARAAASVIAAPFAVVFMLAYGAWCHRAARRAMARPPR
jgi:hypothetical protein